MKTVTEKIDTASHTVPMTGRPIPEARGLPIVGVLPQLFADPLGTLSRIAYAHPRSIVAVPFGPLRAYVVTDPSHVEHVLHTHWRNYTKDAPMWRPLRRLLGNGLATSHGETWLTSRRILQPLFNASYLATLFDQMVETLDRALNQLGKRVGAGREVNLLEEMTVVTQAMILECMFGVTIDDDQARRLGAALTTALGEINLRIFLSFLPERFPLPGERRLSDALRTIDEGVLSLSKRASAEGDRKSLVALLRDATDPDTGRGLSPQQLRDELVTMWGAGNETTATAMSWLWYLLDRHPSVAGELREEVHAVLGERAPRAEDLAALRRCRMAFLESTRLYPPAWLLSRHCIEDDVIDGHRIPAGAMIVVSHYITQRDPQYWDDPGRFDPTRFTPERSAARHRYAYMAFGGGPRRCIGEHFAIMEGQLILAEMTRRFHLRLRPGYRVVPQSTTLLRPRGGPPMIIEPRRA